MHVRHGSLGLLIFALACGPDDEPVAPLIIDPLEGVIEVVVEVPAELVRVGALVNVRVLNGTEETLAPVLDCRRFQAERLDAGTWVPVPEEIFGCVPTVFRIPPREIYEETVRIPADGGPGVYRIAFPHWVASAGVEGFAASNTFRVEPTGVAEVH